ncbi:PqqD family peptide modification chaperone [Salinibacter ruber]|uniref:PqqD family peptide modification chaperone n=1 Tax=Salinibacter ruber TaxID=146919 RepID=UPI000E576BBC|nr:PqqD family peptide modification chaperone [Salinibacter ruber]
MELVTMELTESSTVKAVDHQTSAEVDGENVVLDLENGVYYGLNPVGTQVWNRIQEPVSIGQIVTDLTSEYDVDYERCFDDVVSLLEDLAENGLIVVED